MSMVKKLLNRTLRKARVRSKVVGSEARPRLSVFISNTQVYAQLINDETSKTLASASSLKANKKDSLTKKAEFVGDEIAKLAKKAKVSQVVFDRGGRKYQGRLKALADKAREGGLEF